MSSFTPSLGFVKQEVGENGPLWGNVLNAQLIALVDQAIAAATTLDLTLGSVTLTQSPGAEDQARAMALVATGNPEAGRSLIVPAVNKVYVVSNRTVQSVTVRTATGSGVTVTAGETRMVFVDAASDVVREISVGAETVTPGDTTYATIPSEVDDASDGTTQPTYRAFSEGMLRALKSDGFEVVVDSVEFIVRPQDGSYETPQLTQDKQLFIREDVDLIACYARIVGGALQFFKADGSDWIEGSYRVVYAHELIYSAASV